jgi:hypothetical protein
MSIFEIYCMPKNSKEWKPIMYYIGDIRNVVSRRNRGNICFVQKTPILAMMDAKEEDYYKEDKIKVTPKEFVKILNQYEMFKPETEYSNFTNKQICQAVVDHSTNQSSVAAAQRFLDGCPFKSEGSFTQACYDGDLVRALRLADSSNLQALKTGLNLP